MGLRLNPGIWIWLWAKNGWSSLDPGTIAADLESLGIVGVLPHDSTGGLGWVTASCIETFNAVGISVLPSLGVISTANIVNVLKVQGVVGSMLDWEGYWDGKQAQATQIVNQVLAQIPDANDRVTDCPWWAPLYYLDQSKVHHATHGSGPNAQFGQLAAGQRFVQAYGAPYDGESSGMLAWARDPSQWASMGSWPIFPAHQAYTRSIADCVFTLTAEPTVILWDYLEMDHNARFALTVRKFLTTHGFSGPPAVAEFQKAAGGLSIDNIWGPKSTAAAGLTAPSNPMWTKARSGSCWFWYPPSPYFPHYSASSGMAAPNRSQ
jgi:hypothetical protein